MKRTEMVEHIAAEIEDMFNTRQYSKETDAGFYKRKAANLLDMLLGFDMAPPNLDGNKCLALTSLYYARFTTRMWDEDFDRDHKAVAKWKEIETDPYIKDGIRYPKPANLRGKKTSHT